MKDLNSLDWNGIKYIHFIGIGGISMSGLAGILMNFGYKISGSDQKCSPITKKLENAGVNINYNHSAENISNPDLVVYSAAVKQDNPEIVKAKSLGIQVIERAVLLGQLMKRYPFSIAVSGTHGKTTTSSMVSMIMIEAGTDPTIQIGGELDAIGGNTRIGSSKFFVAEACEYVESFLKFYPFLAIILNIEADHLDYYRDIEHIKEAFFKFASLVPKEGYLIANADDPNVTGLIDRVACNVITYSIKSSNAAWRVSDIAFDSMGRASFNVLLNGKDQGRIQLGVTGMHNVSNSLAAIAACHTAGCSFSQISSGLSRFTGTHRRFERKGEFEGIAIIDDYAHHPSEIKATLKAARNSHRSKIWCVFQPHTYTRTKALLDDFAVSFGDADRVIVADIYAAREQDTGDIHSSTLAKRIKENGTNAIYLGSFDAIAEYLKMHASPGDIIITMGAGDIFKVGEMLIASKKAAVS